MIRLDPTTGTFTSTHLSFIKLCMETRSYAAAEPILDNYIHTLPTKATSVMRESLEYSVPCSDVASSGDYIYHTSGHSEKITLSDVQEYYLLGAMAYLGLRRFKKAQHMLEHVLIVPCNNVANGFMLEAYKKWVLLGCLVDGKVRCASVVEQKKRSNRFKPRTLPRTGNANATKQLKSASKAYEALTEAYVQLNNLPKLKAQVRAGADIWAEVCLSRLQQVVSTRANQRVGWKHWSCERTYQQSNEDICRQAVTDLLIHSRLKYRQQRGRHS